MTGSGGKMLKKKGPSSKPDGVPAKDCRRMEQMQVRPDAERRSKQSHERPSSNAGKGKGKSHAQTPVPKKQRFVDRADSDSQVQHESSDDSDWSGEDDTDGVYSDSDGSDDSGTGSPRVGRGHHGRDKVMKKPVTLDINGAPWGSMKECLADDIKKYAKSLDPTANWKSQPAPLRSQLFTRLYKDWDMLGQSFKLSEKWVGPIVTKVLITTRWRLNTLIDAGQLKPADVTQEQWNTLVRRRNTEDSHILSEHMRSISQGKGSKVAQLKAIEKDAIVKLTLQHGRKPYQTEITDEVAREYTRQQVEKRKAALQKGTDMDEVRTRVVDMEESVSRLEEKIGESQSRMEEMLKSFMVAQTKPCGNISRSASPIRRGGEVPQHSAMFTEHSGPGGPSIVVLQKAPPTAVVDMTEEEAADGRDSIRKMPSLDSRDEEFIKDLLQDPNAVMGFADGSKSPDTVVLSGQVDDLPKDVCREGMVEVQASNVSPAKGGKSTPTVPPEQEVDAIAEPTSRPRRSLIQTQLMKPASQAAPPKPTKSNVGKSLSGKKFEPSKKK